MHAKASLEDVDKHATNRDFDAPPVSCTNTTSTRRKPGGESKAESRRKRSKSGQEVCRVLSGVVESAGRPKPSSTRPRGEIPERPTPLRRDELNAPSRGDSCGLLQLIRWNSALLLLAAAAAAAAAVVGDVGLECSRCGCSCCCCCCCCCCRGCCCCRCCYCCNYCRLNFVLLLNPA